MNSIYWLVISISWFAFGIFIIAKRCSRLEEEQIPTELNHFLPIFVGLSGLMFLIVIPMFMHRHYVITHWIHHTAFFGLFLFLLAAQALQVEGYFKLKHGAKPESLLLTYKRLWWLTEVVPAPLAVGILASGLGLICQDAISDPTGEVLENYSLRSGWLMALVCSFGFFFWDGIFGFSVAVRKMRLFWVASQLSKVSTTELRRHFQDKSRDIQLLIHCLSFPFVFLFGALRQPAGNIFSRYVIFCENKLLFLPHGLPQVCVALGVWLAMGLLILILRTLFLPKEIVRPVAPTSHKR